MRWELKDNSAHPASWKEPGPALQGLTRGQHQPLVVASGAVALFELGSDHEARNWEVGEHFSPLKTKITHLGYSDFCRLKLYVVLVGK